MRSTDIVAAAATALGTPLRDPQRLAGSSRTTVLRCHTGDGTVIVKAHRDREFHAVEAAGLAFTTYGPTLLASDPDAQLCVMSDLGAGPNLADLLLGDDPGAAERALTAWATTYGRIAVETHGRQAEYQRLCARYGATVEHPLVDHARLADALSAYRITPPAGLAGELAALDRAPALEVFSPGDICPDNNVLTDEGLRVIDFEGAGYHSVHLDAAYTTMPFSSCWCVFRLPDDISRHIETVYRDAVTSICPALADDDVWRTGMRDAIATYTVSVTEWLGPRAVTADKPMHPNRNPVPTSRQLLRHRWTRLATVLGPDQPALAEVTARLLDATEHWQAEPLPLYPAFTPRPPTVVNS